MTPPVDLDKIERLARAADPWTVAVTEDGDLWIDGAQCIALVAALPPSTVLAWIAESRAKDAALAEARATVERMAAVIDASRAVVDIAVTRNIAALARALRDFDAPTKGTDRE